MGNGSLETTVLDAGPVIHLSKIGALHLLSVFEKVVLPEAVYEEIYAGDPPAELEELDYEIVKSDSEDIFEDLDEGESAALSVAQDLEDQVVFLTDDLEAREAAKDIGIEVHGSVGVIVLGYRKGRLEFQDASSKIRSLEQDTGMFITDAVVERGIEILEEISESNRHT